MNSLLVKSCSCKTKIPPPTPKHTHMHAHMYNNISNHTEKDLIPPTKKASPVPGVSLFSQVLSNNIWLKFSMLQGSQASFPDISVLSLWVKETYFWLSVKLPTTLYYQTTMLKAGMHTFALISTENHNSSLLLSPLLLSPLGDKWLSRSHPFLHFDLLFTSSIFFPLPWPIPIWAIILSTVRKILSFCSQ